MRDRKALVYKGMPPYVTCCDQRLRILPDGEWVCLFMTGGATEPCRDNFVALCRSSDEGQTWGEMETVFRPEGEAAVLTEVLLHNGVITAFVHTHDGGLGRWRNWTIRSADGGRAWTAPDLFDPLPRRAYVRNLYRATWGEWYLPYQYYEAPGDPDVPVTCDGSFENMWIGALISADEGATWAEGGRVRSALWAENGVVELHDGRMVMLNRRDGTGCLWHSESADRGRSWKGPNRTGIPNPGSKFMLRRLTDGRVVLIHNPNPATAHPNSKRCAQCNRNPLALWVSDDDMQTWSHQRIVVDFPGMVAYPDGVVSEDERMVHFAFDYNRHDIIYWGAVLPA
jgi:predicted neuraminidase